MADSGPALVAVQLVEAAHFVRRAEPVAQPAVAALHFAVLVVLPAVARVVAFAAQPAAGAPVHSQAGVAVPPVRGAAVAVGDSTADAAAPCADRDPAAAVRLFRRPHHQVAAHREMGMAAAHIPDPDSQAGNTAVQAADKAAVHSHNPAAATDKRRGPADPLAAPVADRRRNRKIVGWQNRRGQRSRLRTSHPRSSTPLHCCRRE